MVGRGTVGSVSSSAVSRVPIRFYLLEGPAPSRLPPTPCTSDGNAAPPGWAIPSCRGPSLVCGLPASLGPGSSPLRCQPWPAPAPRPGPGHRPIGCRGETSLFPCRPSPGAPPLPSWLPPDHQGCPVPFSDAWLTVMRVNFPPLE